jgi:hypothetical protein
MRYVILYFTSSALRLGKSRCPMKIDSHFFHIIGKMDRKGRALLLVFADANLQMHKRLTGDRIWLDLYTQINRDGQKYIVFTIYMNFRPIVNHVMYKDQFVITYYKNNIEYSEDIKTLLTRLHAPMGHEVRIKADSLDDHWELRISRKITITDAHDNKIVISDAICSEIVKAVLKKFKPVMREDP